MVYVARFSNNIEGDIKRGWSAYMGPIYTSPAEWATDCLFADDIAEREGVETIEMVSDDDILYWADKLANTELRLDEQFGAWRVWHHDGLSCWLLDATDEASAVAEANAKIAAKQIDQSGWGWATVGDIEVVATITLSTGSQVHILRCEDAYPEH